MTKQPSTCEKLRKQLLNWHYKKCRDAGIFDLLESDYQQFRYMVQRRVGRGIDFREAIKIATEDELLLLMQVRDEKRLGI